MVAFSGLWFGFEIRHNHCSAVLSLFSFIPNYHESLMMFRDSKQLFEVHGLTQLG